jgi:hypothetical protein
MIITKLRSICSLLTCIFILQIHAQVVTKQINANILQSKQGSIVLLADFLSEKGILSMEYNKIVLPGPQHLISDDPEYIRIPEGIAFQEAVQPGSVRLYMYNVNGVKEPANLYRKITSVIKNTGDEVMHIRMLKYSSQKPSNNYFLIGKQGLADYFVSNGEKKIRNVKPGECIPIDEKMEKNIVKYDELAHGFYEFTIDQPGQISVIQTDLQTPGPIALSRIKTVIENSNKNAGRGVFGVSNYKITSKDVLDTKNGSVQLIVADGEKDKWVEGYEGSGAKFARLEGNYGIIYNIEVKWKSTDGKGLALVTWNSRGGNNQGCGGMAASMVVSQGKFEGGVIQLPSDKLTTSKKPEAILIQVFPPAVNGEEQTIKLTYSPPGASCLPTPLVFIPIDMK